MFEHTVMKRLFQLLHKYHSDDIKTVGWYDAAIAASSMETSGNRIDHQCVKEDRTKVGS